MGCFSEGTKAFGVVWQSLWLHLLTPFLIPLIWIKRKDCYLVMLCRINAFFFPSFWKVKKCILRISLSPQTFWTKIIGRTNVFSFCFVFVIIILTCFEKFKTVKHVKSRKLFLCFTLTIAFNNKWSRLFTVQTLLSHYQQEHL